ncbi:Low affinity iron permease [Thozetella sp. PMI_491]|nr:Low affinity iron permease [Thozetella sp. PMI_491]
MTVARKTFANKLFRALCSPGARADIEETAPTQRVLETSNHANEGSDTNDTGFAIKLKKRRLDRWLDVLVHASGSEPIFLLILAGLLAWAFLGVTYGSSTSWAIIISDVQAIVSYFFDSLLMRQQLNSYDRFIRVAAGLRSRSLTHRRMLSEIMTREEYRVVEMVWMGSSEGAEGGAELPRKTLVGRVSAHAARVMGHIVTVVLFWAGIFVWLGFGQSMGWSDEWQLYINSATSALMVFIFAFLANIREHHHYYMEKCVELIFEVDSAVEVRLRSITGDAMPNLPVIIPAPRVNKVQRIIFYYADVVGTLVGIALLIIVMVAWVSIGPVMEFNSNWWLLIGTYAGLVGLNDGFVLRNVQARLSEYEDMAFDQVSAEDASIFVDMGIPDPKVAHTEVNSINYRLSRTMGAVCASEATVIFGIFLIFGLITAASIMRWTTTGQLICNIPPSIIESFFMMILIVGHNIGDVRRRVDFQNMYLRRLRLLACVNNLQTNLQDGKLQ